MALDPRIAQQKHQVTAGLFFSEVHAHKAQGQAAVGRIEVYPDDLIVGQQGQNTQPEIATDARDQDGRFRATHGPAATPTHHGEICNVPPATGDIPRQNPSTQARADRAQP